MERKIQIVKEMVALGYCLFDETVEHFANRFDEHILEHFLESFKKRLDK